MSDDRTKRPVTLAVVTGAHGVAGEVRLKLFGEGVPALKRYRAFNEGSLTPKSIRDDNKGGAIARFAEVTDRNAAEALRGTELSVARADMPPLAMGEYYHADLIGLSVVTDAGEAIGAVVAVENFGAGDVLEIEKFPNEDGKRVRFMVPMTTAAIPVWDMRTITLTAAFAE